MTTTRTFWRLAKLPLAVSLASAIAAPAYAVNFNIGEIEGQVDSSLSVGASWSMSGANKDLIGVLNSTHKCNAHPCINFVRRLPAQAFSRA